MSNFVLEGNFVMDTIEFKSVLDEIIDILSSCESMINADSDECFVCRNDIKENENNATCESCDKHFHVSCIYKSDEKLADQRLIWICLCGNNNIAHRIFDKVCIPSHLNRYEVLQTDWESETDHWPTSSKNLSDKNPNCIRKGKRYVKKNRRNVPQKQRTEMTGNACNQRKPASDVVVENGDLNGNEWVTVKSRKVKMMERRERKTDTGNVNKEKREANDHLKRSVNGVILEPGVTYIGKAMKEYYDRRRSRNGKKKSNVKTKNGTDNEKYQQIGNMKCQQPKDYTVQRNVESLLDVYAKCVQEKQTMILSSGKDVASKQKHKTWANVVKNPQNHPQKSHIVLISDSVIQVTKQYNPEIFRIHGDRRRKQQLARDSKGCFTCKKQVVVNDESHQILEGRSHQNEVGKFDIKSKQNDQTRKKNVMENESAIPCEAEVKEKSANVKNKSCQKTNILISLELVTCCVCNHQIEKDESYARCEFCRNHFHKTCMGFCCGNKEIDRLLMDTVEFKTIVDDILDILSSCASMMSSEYDPCVCNQNKANKSIATIEITMTSPDVGDELQNITRAFEGVKTDACTCHVLQQGTDDGCIIQQLYGGGRKSKLARTKDGRFVSKTKLNNKEKSEHGDEKSKSNESDKHNTDCRPNHDNANPQSSCSNQVFSMNEDQHFKTGNLVCNEDRNNEIKIDDHSNSKADQSVKNESDCRPNHANVNPQNKSQRNLISPELETCCICNHEIEQNESKAMCDSCRNHYHATCKGFACKLKKLSGNTIKFKTIPDEISDVMSMNVDQDLITGNLVCDTDIDKSNEIIIDDHSDSHVPGEDVCARDSDSHRSDTYQYERNVSPMSFNICGKPKDCPVNQELDKTHESVCKNEDIIKHNELNDIDDEETEFESNKGTFGSIYTLNSDSLQRHSYTTIKTIAQGNFHQGDPKFGDTAGTQCACNALIAILYTQTKNGNEINAHDMDVILNLGDELYSFTQTDSTMHNVLLMISELPNELHILNESFSMEYVQPIYGVLEGSEENLSSFGAMSLSQALQHQLPKYDACFMNFDQSIFAIIKGCNGYFVFDSHSRSRDGYLKEDGHSVLLYISSCEGIQRHCLTLAQSMGLCLNKTQFELTGVNVQVNRPSSYVSSSAECEKSNYVKNGNSDKQKILEIEEDLNENSDTDETDDGIIFISHDRCTERSDKYFKFVPLQTEDKKMLCCKLNINYCGTHSESLENQNGNMYIGKPIDIKRSIGDGNCYYRTMAYAISGTERNHLLLRKANITHLLENEDLFRCTLDTSTYNSVREHVFANRLMDSERWSNDTEIFSFANMIGFDIYSYNDQTQYWQIFCAKEPGHYNKITTERGIYMLYTGGNHFDAVESVANVDLSIVEEEDLINVGETEVINVDSNLETDVLLNESCIKERKRKLQTHKENEVILEPKCKDIKGINHVDSACDVKAVRTKRSANVERELRKQRKRLKRCQEKSRCNDKINEGASNKSHKAKNADAMKKKYQNDLSYRLQHALNQKEAYKRNYNSTFESEYNEKLKSGEKIDNCNMTYSDKNKENIKKIAKDNCKHLSFRDNLKLHRKEQYHNDQCFRQDKKEKSQERRRQMYTNPELREKMKETTRERYKNPELREKIKETTELRENIKETTRERYKNPDKRKV